MKFFGLCKQFQLFNRSFSSSLIASLIFSGLANAQIQRDKSLEGDVNQYVVEIMKKLPVTPGLAVAIVRGDKILFAKGFGYRDVKTKLPVTRQTQFYIASTTKSFTATAAKLLADEGKFDLDAPIKKYFPNLVLKPPLSVEQITVRDLLTHRSGLSNEAINFRAAYTGQINNDIVLDLLGNYSKSVSPEFRYSNIGYIVAAVAMEKAAGETWQQIVERKIIAPLNLKSTTAFASKAKASGDFALPYLAENRGFTELAYKDDSTMHAAGGMVSSAEDLAKWLIVNMNGGMFEGKQIIPAAALEEILAPQINQKRDFYKFKRYAYSLGWNIGTYNGEKFVHCFGEFPGFRPHVSFMPGHKTGVVVLVNESTDAFLLPDLIATDIYDYLIYGKPLQTNANPKIDEYLVNLQKERAKKEVAQSSDKKPGPRPTLEPGIYAGTYENPEWGKIVVTADGKMLAARFGSLSSTLLPLTSDTFEVTFLASQVNKITFKMESNAIVSGLSFMGQTFAKVQPGS
ncbi:MAG TPA: serine hydrolase [Pyrinomonadaceae bacterium]|nr:serine hydrolase [Pyrinomonadaceae bacterium]